MASDIREGVDFVRARVAGDLATKKYGGRVVTRFPPEPNGFLHIGHAKSICLNFGIAQENAGGVCHLRFDDTNPETEEIKYVESIQNDVRWLGFDWGDEPCFSSDYFEKLYEYAVALIKSGHAYVDSSSEDEIRKNRGTVKKPGTASPYRDRTPEKNLDLFERMRNGEFKDGEHVLRAKADLSAPNMKMRDPLLYRIRHATHYRTGDDWCIYPFYDFTHCLSDYIERITHSICTLEFENNRELYDWILHTVEEAPYPEQTEFARLNLSFTVLSKRKLLRLVAEGHVSGWDDPRMPTLAGFRRRGYTPESIRNFCDRIGIARADNVVDVAQLEFSIRDDLNTKAPRVMGVLRPVKLVIDNYPEDQVDELDAPYLPDNPDELGYRKVPFSRVLFIENTDFMENAPKKYFRLTPGKEVRLRWAYLVTCTGCVKDDNGDVVEVHCTYDPETRGGSPPDGRKVKGTIHWVSAAHALKAEVRLYDRLFNSERPDDGEDFITELNPRSLEVISDARVEPSLENAEPGSHIQFERTGYFCVDTVDSKPGHPVFNRTVPLRDSWAKMVKAGKV